MKQTHRPPRSIYPAQNRHMRRRTRVLAGLVAVLCFGGLLARLFTLQILDPSGYANRAAAQQLQDSTLPAARGEIYSADGITLAASKTCWTIRASPRELADELVQPAAKALSEILNIDYDATLQKLSKRTSTTACSAAGWMLIWRTPCGLVHREQRAGVSRFCRIPSLAVYRGQLYGLPAGLLY